MVRRAVKYDRALSGVRSIVNAHDPIGLLGLGTPDDEYETEVAELTRMVVGPDPVAEDVVNDVWVRWFGPEYGLAGTEQPATLTRDLRALQVELVEE